MRWLPLLLGGCLFALSGDVSGEQARKLVADGALLLDVRSPEEYVAGHVEGARNVPVQAIARAVWGDPNRPVVVYCQSGMRSRRAAGLLRERGFTSVYDLGAMSRW
jgi:phage shock protein E